MKKIIISLVIGILIGGIILSYEFPRQSVVVGSVSQGGEYIATTSISSWAGTMHVIATSTKVSMLGSVVIGVTDSRVLSIMDATSSTDVSSTTIATIGASPANGSTMIFDVRLLRGLVVNVPASFAGTYTITYR